MKPHSVAETYWYLHRQPRDAWTHELDLRPFRESWCLDGIQQPKVKARLKETTDAAVDRGVFGSPSFFVEGELYFGEDRLRDVEEEILRRKHPTPAA